MALAPPAQPLGQDIPANCSAIAQHELAAADQEWLSLAVNSLASSSARKGEGGAAAGAAAGCDGPAGLVLEVPLWSPVVAAAAAAGLPARVRIIAQDVRALWSCCVADAARDAHARGAEARTTILVSATS